MVSCLCLQTTYVFCILISTTSLIFEFSRLNRLLLNSIINLILFRPHSLSINNYLDVYINGKVVSKTQSVKYLGIILQSNLCWDLYISAVKRRIAPAIEILKLKNKLVWNLKLMIYQFWIHFHLNYLAITYAYNKHNSILRSLKRMQNLLTFLLTFTKNFLFPL